MNTTPRPTLSRWMFLPALVACVCQFLPAIEAAGPPADNLALARPVTASSENGTNLASRVVDYRYATNWQAAAPGPGQWLRVDLGEPRAISGVEFRFNNGGNFGNVRGYTVEVSDDDASWSAVVEAPAANTQIRYHPFTATARYVRWTLTSIATSASNPNPATVQLSEFWVFGPPANPLPPLPSVSDPAPPYINTSFVRGADVSHLLQNEHYGARYFDADHVEKDPLQILKEHGINAIRIKVWNDPGNRAFTPARLHDPLGFNNPYWAARLAIRARELGFRIMVDFHFSDTWADPGKQFMPHEWLGLPADEVALRLYDFTYDTLRTMADHGVVPEWVQIGNEMGGGMMWPLGRYWDTANSGSWPNLALFLKAGYQATKDVDPSIKVVIHHAESGRLADTQWFYEQVRDNDVPWDVIGLSYYPQWHGTFEAMNATVLNLASIFGKPVNIVEVAHPWTTQGFDETGNSLGIPNDFIYPASVEGQIGYLDEVAIRLKNVPNGLGEGMIYWQPEWTPLPGALPASTSTATGGAGWAIGEASGWENAALFNQDGIALPSLYALGNLAPEVTSTAAVNLDEGSLAVISGSFADSGVNTWTALTDFGDGSLPEETVLNPDKTFNLTHTYADNGTFSATVKVTDDEDRTGESVTIVSVHNLAPLVDTPTVSPSPSYKRDPAVASATFSDPGVDDAPFTVTVNYGDGSGELPGTVNGNSGAGPAHVYQAVGTFQVTVTITDKDGGTRASTTTHTVLAKSAPAQLDDLTSAVLGSPIQPVFKLTLLAPLALVEVAQDYHRPQLARSALNAFDLVVRSLQQARKLSATQAADLLGRSQDLRAAISG